MEKSIKQKLREAEQQNHEEFRKQLIEDIYHLLEEYNEQITTQLTDNLRQVNASTKTIKEVEANIDQTNNKLTQIRQRTLGEVRSFKRGFRWTFYGCCFLFGLLGSLAGIAICGAYWPTIRWLLGA